MKLRRIALHNLRRFTAPVELTGLTDGLNVLSAPNEQGKSTLFDGLQALFFSAHGGRPKEIKSLQPYAGGAPEMLAEIETGEGRFTLAKRWLSKPRATVHRNGTLIAQADEAEAWITRLAASDAGGPGGLLWVRQGLTGLQEGTARDASAALDTRRDLLSSVTGEVETMTGGQRMDAALKRCRADLDHYVTATGRPRSGGPLKAAQDRVAELTAQQADMARTVHEMQDDLAARKRARAELQDLTEPETAARRATRLAQAKADFAAAEQHAALIERLARQTDTARLRHDALLAQQKSDREAQQEQTDAQQQAQQAEARKAKADTAQAEDQNKANAARADLTSARSALLEADQRLQAARKAQRARDTARQRTDLSERLTQAEALQQVVNAARADAAQGPSAQDLKALERKAAALDQARALQAASAARLEITYDPGQEGRILQDGRALPASTPLPLIGQTDLQIPGIGRLHFSPGGSGEDGSVDTAQAALTAALQALDVDSLRAARAQAEARLNAERKLAEAQAALRAHAPKGLDALRAALAELPPPVTDDTTPPLSLEEAEALRAQADTTRIAAEAAFETARDRFEATRTEAAQAQAAAQAAQDRLERAAAALARRAPLSAADLASNLDAARNALTEAETAQAEAMARAPDLENTQAALSRAHSAERAAEQSIARLNLELARLDERVRRSAEGAVEERLSELEQDLSVAEGALARMTREVAVLDRLARALETARIAARDRYFTPVANALRPLLHLLWPEAELDWDDSDLLPRHLIRAGREEPMGILSGGTQEQLALLVRLAFARLLAQDGRAAPVILDDALVYTDDDRIERMFDALHRQASDVQILVLTCRQRAFRDLGGQPLQFQPLALSGDSLLGL